MPTGLNEAGEDLKVKMKCSKDNYNYYSNEYLYKYGALCASQQTIVFDETKEASLTDIVMDYYDADKEFTP